MKWLWIALVLAAFTGLSLFTYIGKVNYLNEVGSQIANEPHLSDYQYESELIAEGLRDSNGKHGKNYSEFGKTSLQLTQILSRLDQPWTEKNDIQVFIEKQPVPTAQQDSLWEAFSAYRKAINNTLSNLLPERHQLYERYQKVLRVSTSRPASRKETKKLQARLDSLALFPGGPYPIALNDSVLMSKFIYYLEKNSDPADELKMNTLLNKLDNLFSAKGKLMLYGRAYNLNEMTTPERRNAVRQMVILKRAIDLQLYKMARP